MLVLKRKWGEKIVLSNGITVVLVRSDSASARIGIEAPDDIEILRAELLEPEQAETP